MKRRQAGDRSKAFARKQSAEKAVRSRAQTRRPHSPRVAFPATILAVLVIATVTACGLQRGPDDEDTGLEACDNYVEALTHCLPPGAPATSRLKTTLHDQISHLDRGDDTEREKIVASCNFNQQNLARACR